MECTRIILSAAHRYFLGESLIQLLAVGIQFLANLAAGCQKNQDLVWDHFYMHLKWVALCVCQSLSPSSSAATCPPFSSPIVSISLFICLFYKSVWCPPKPPSNFLFSFYFVIISLGHQMQKCTGLEASVAEIVMIQSECEDPVDPCVQVGVVRIQLLKLCLGQTSIGILSCTNSTVCLVFEHLIGVDKPLTNGPLLLNFQPHFLELS